MPLLAHDLEHRRVFRDLDEIRPYKQAGGQHGDDAHGGHYSEPPFQLLVLRFVVRPLSLAVPVADHDERQEQVDGDENDARHPEREHDRVVHGHPVRRDRREPPGTQEMKDQRGDDQQDQHDSNRHRRTLDKVRSPLSGALRTPTRQASACGNVREQLTA